MTGSPGCALEVKAVSVRFGELRALEAVSLSVRSDEIVGLIGPNGSGKTTLVNVITGFLVPAAGTVVMDGRDITRVRPAARAAVGLARTFQAVRLFGRMTVAENIEIGALAVGVPPRAARLRVAALLERLSLGAVQHVSANALPYGLERRVAIARALASEPLFLLLDEPAAGLDEAETDELSSILRAVRDDVGCGLLIIEHDMRLINDICDRAHVLASGASLAEGAPSDVMRDPGVIEAYLGKAAADAYA